MLSCIQVILTLSNPTEVDVNAYLPWIEERASVMRAALLRSPGGDVDIKVGRSMHQNS